MRIGLSTDRVYPIKRTWGVGFVFIAIVLTTEMNLLKIDEIVALIEIVSFSYSLDMD